MPHWLPIFQNWISSLYFINFIVIFGKFFTYWSQFITSFQILIYIKMKQMWILRNTGFLVFTFDLLDKQWISIWSLLNICWIQTQIQTLISDGYLARCSWSQSHCTVIFWPAGANVIKLFCQYIKDFCNKLECLLD